MKEERNIWGAKHPTFTAMKIFFIGFVGFAGYTAGKTEQKKQTIIEVKEAYERGLKHGNPIDKKKAEQTYEFVRDLKEAELWDKIEDFCIY
jgi:hypothetical protein